MMPNNDYILRSDAINALTVSALLRNLDSVEDGPAHMYKRAAERIIAGVPAADVEPKRKMGQWIDVYVSNPARMRTMCSECGLFSGIGGIPSNRHKPYCPNCGSPMLPEPPNGEDDDSN